METDAEAARGSTDRVAAGAATLSPSAPSRLVAESDALETICRNIIVATDGRGPAERALIAGHALAGSHTFGVISVLADASSKDRASGWAPLPGTSDAHRELVDAQVHRALGESPDAWVDVQRGYPPAVLAAFAESRGSSLLVVGIGRPGVLDRLLGDESALRIARMTRTPLYVVAPGGATPPRCIVVATDFSATSARAARLALTLAAPDAEVFLAHVSTPAGRLAPEGGLRRQAEALQERFSGRITPLELRGDAATELLSVAKSRGADAIALGGHGYGNIVRYTLGPVATRVVRCAPCSVILAPAS